MPWKRFDSAISISEKFALIEPRAFQVWAFVLPWADKMGVYTPQNAKEFEILKHAVKAGNILFN